MLCIVSFILLNHTVKSFQAVQIKMRLQLNLKILQLRFLNGQLIFISADFQMVNFIHHSVKSGIKDGKFTDKLCFLQF
ncbi:MAG: hypothetical protein BHV85_04720 [Blautia sp. CAG:37_48_57]|nr:MAG: hypothetical protein BHV85_04720 [Blautia sp. CAG:37_48_57]